MASAPSPDHTGNWLWHPAAGEPNTYLEFILAPGTPALRPAPGDELRLSAQTSYRLCLDDEPRHWGPLREIAPYFYVDHHDLAALTGDAAPRLSLLAHHQGARSHTYAPGTPALFVGCCVHAADGSVIDLAAPAAWRCRRITRLRADAHRLGACVGFAEHVDFHVAPDEDWQTPVLVATHPWSERPTWLDRNLPPFPRERVSPAAVTPFGGGWLVDFGVQLFGFVDLRFRADQAVDFELHYGEVLDEGVVDPRRHLLVDYRDRLRAPAGAHRWLSYEKRALRYVFVTHPVTIEDIGLVQQNRPLPSVYRDTPAWRSRAATETGCHLNRILEVSDRTIRNNVDDILTDCPWRERAQYADFFYCMETFQRLYGDLGHYARFLRQYARGAGADGALRMCYPSPPGQTVIPDFSLTFPQMLATYGRLSGDWPLVEQLLPNAEAAVNVWKKHEQAGLLVNPPGWVFLDNCSEAVKTPRCAGLNAVWAGAQGVLADLLTRFGHAEKTARHRVKREESRAAFRRTFLRDGRQLDADPIPEWESRRYWNYHHQAATGRWDWSGGDRRFVLRFNVRAEHEATLDFRFWSPAEVRIDGERRVRQERARQIWGEGNPVSIAGGRWHRVTVAVGFHVWDWEYYLASDQPLELAPAMAWEEPGAPKPLAPHDSPADAAAPEPAPRGHVRATEMRPWTFPWLNQVTVGYAAYYDLLEPDEARRLLRAALPAAYDTPWMKRVTPFFATETNDRARLEKRVQPCWVAASSFHFVEALVRHGLRAEARSYLSMLYDGMLARGATAWWEEWERRSSNCHPWAAFGVHHLLDAESEDPADRPIVAPRPPRT